MKLFNLLSWATLSLCFSSCRQELFDNDGVYNDQVMSYLRFKNNNFLSLFLLLSAIFLVSCQISGLTSGYSHLSTNAKKYVINYDGNIQSINNYSFIYNVTSQQVIDFLTSNDEVLIFDYTPYCRSQYCINPKVLYEFCKANSVKLLVISNIYDDVFKAVNNDFPILMINTSAYSTKWRGKYIRLFYQSLLGTSDKEKFFFSYHYFRKGKYVESFKGSEDFFNYHEKM